LRKQGAGDAGEEIGKGIGGSEGRHVEEDGGRRISGKKLAIDVYTTLQGHFREPGRKALEKTKKEGGKKEEPPDLFFLQAAGTRKKEAVLAVLDPERTEVKKTKGILGIGTEKGG